MFEGRAGAVELVDEADARHLGLVGVAPVGLGLRLHACDAVEDDDGAVEDAHRALYLGGEVDVARRVDDVEAVFLGGVLLVRLVRRVPEAGDGGGCDSDAALALLLHPVGRGVAVMHFAYLVRAAGVEKHALAGGGLARVDVGDDAEVAHASSG